MIAAMEQVKLISGLATSKYTEVFYEKDYQFNAPHHFEVRSVDDGEIVTEVHFQEGPIKESGINGVANEDLIAMVIRRLEGFQSSDFRCRENAVAITKLEESLMWLSKRTLDREARGVEGTHKV